MRKLLTLLMCVLLASALKAQELSDTLTLYFHRASSVVDTEYKENGPRSEAFFNKIRAIQNIANMDIVSIDLLGTSSPEGLYKYNTRLSERRKNAVLEYLKKNVEVSDITFRTNSLVEDWSIVADLIMRDPQVPYRDQVLEVIRSFEGKQDFEEDIVAALRKIDPKNANTVLNYLHENIFPELRACNVIAIYHFDYFVDAIIEDIEDIPLEDFEFEPFKEDTLRVEPIHIKTFTPFIKVKTNTIGLAMGHANIAVEYAIAEHFSVALPFYYSGGFDYFSPELKFRGIVLQPEARYYIKGNEGFYVGAHLGVGWYNYALNGEYRIQDHKGNRPAFGGGLGLGYALDFKKAPRWGMEFSLGAGVYDVKYDIFYNEPNGAYAERGVHNTFFGIDNAAVSFTYKIPVKKEGRK